jgi:hypothetical protein
VVADRNLQHLLIRSKSARPLTIQLRRTGPCRVAAVARCLEGEVDLVDCRLRRSHVATPLGKRPNCDSLVACGHGQWSGKRSRTSSLSAWRWAATAFSSQAGPAPRSPITRSASVTALGTPAIGLALARGSALSAPPDTRQRPLGASPCRSPDGPTCRALPQSSIIAPPDGTRSPVSSSSALRKAAGLFESVGAALAPAKSKERGGDHSAPLRSRAAFALGSAPSALLGWEGPPRRSRPICLAHRHDRHPHRWPR